MPIGRMTDSRANKVDRCTLTCRDVQGVGVLGKTWLGLLPSADPTGALHVRSPSHTA